MTVVQTTESSRVLVPGLPSRPRSSATCRRCTARVNSIRGPPSSSRRSGFSPALRPPVAVASGELPSLALRLRGRLADRGPEHPRWPARRARFRPRRGARAHGPARSHRSAKPPPARCPSGRPNVPRDSDAAPRLQPSKGHELSTPVDRRPRPTAAVTIGPRPRRAFRGATMRIAATPMAQGQAPAA